MKEFFSNIKFAWRYAKTQKKRLILYIIFNVVSIIVGILMPLLSAQMVVALTTNELTQLLYLGVMMLGLDIFNTFFRHLSRYLTSRIYRETFSLMQIALGREIVKIENKCFDQTSSGVFIHRLTNDTSNLADIFNVLSIHIGQIIMYLGVFITVAIINIYAFCFLVVYVGIVYLIDRKKNQKVTELDKVFRAKKERMFGFIGELVRGVRDIKMLNAEESFLGELNTKIYDMNQERYRMQGSERKYTSFRLSAISLLDFGFVVLLTILISSGNLTATMALVIYNYGFRVTSLSYEVSYLLEGIRDFNLSATRVRDIIEGNLYEKEVFGTKHLDRIEGNFSFKDVSFKYDKDNVLNHISFDVKANETVAFVGKSGSGKSTIFSLLCKMYDINKGSITIDGIDIKELDKDSIRGNITVISQSPYIFNLSIKENLRLVKNDLTDKEMIDACKLACLHDFIMKLPDKYDTLVGEGGVNLSGGERQRLAIARALVQKTEIILFDEATSALDNDTQAHIQKAIENMKKEYTIMIIAHRLSTVINSDRIFFINKGKIESVGTHLELLKHNDNYKKLYEAELKEE